MSQVIFLIPGFRTQISDPRYEQLTAYLKSQHYTVFGVPITWHNKTVTENAAEFVAYFAEKKAATNYVLGFSYGAVIALMTAKQVQPEKLILCSLSPDFSEDALVMPGGIKRYIGTRRYADTLTRSGVQLARSLEVETVVFCGEQEGEEYPQLKKRCTETAALAKHAALIMVEDAPHDISFPSYQAAIRKVL